MWRTCFPVRMVRNNYLPIFDKMRTNPEYTFIETFRIGEPRISVVVNCILSVAPRGEKCLVHYKFLTSL